MDSPPFDIEPLKHIHPLVRTNRQHIESLNNEIRELTKSASQRLTELRLITNEKVNKNRISKHFKVNDYVFVLDRYSMPGNTRPLKTRFHPSPYVVIRPLWTTTLVKRLGDGFTALHGNDDFKNMKAIALYSPTYQKKYHVFYYTIFGNYYSLIYPQLQNMIVLKFHPELFYLILIQKSDPNS